MIDFERLLAPISEDSPTGDDLRYVDGDLTFEQIEENRAEEDPALTVEGEAKSANWKAVVRDCQEALASKSKDLQLVAWLCEGLAHTEGFPGVRDGLRLAKEMIHGHWERLHPGFEDDEIVLPIRARPVAWLASDRCFLPAVKAIPLTYGGSGALSWSDRERAALVDDAQLQSDPEKYQELLDGGGVTSETWRQALTDTPLDRVQDTLAALDECRSEIEELGKLVNERFEDDAPTLAPLDDLLSDIREVLQRALPGGEADEAEHGAGEIGEAAGEVPAAGGGPRISGPIQTRQQALQQLALVASFFRKTEPHSPIAYLVQRAARWGEMSLEDLLKEVVKDSSTLEHIWETLGLAPEPEGDE